MKREEGLELLEKTRIIAVIRGVERERILRVAEALLAGGIRAVEITLNTVGAYYAIKDLQKEFGKKLFIGADNVLDTQDVKAAAEAGASFFVTPITDKKVIEYAVEEDIPIFPGAFTPTEVVKAWKAGATAVNIFPTSPYGLSYVKELLGSLSHIPLVATGGINEDNIADFIRAGCRGVGVGSAVINPEEIAKGNYEWVKERAAALIAKAVGASEEIE